MSNNRNFIEKLCSLQSVMVGIKKSTTAEDVLLLVCNRRQLNPQDHYVRVRLQGAPEGSYQYPNKGENIKKLVSIASLDPATCMYCVDDCA